MRATLIQRPMDFCDRMIEGFCVHSEKRFRTSFMIETIKNRRVFYITLFCAALGAVCGAALIAHGYVGYYTRYMADDYCSIGNYRTSGLIGMQRDLYVGWSGRFSFTFAIGLAAVFGGTKLVPYLPALALIVWLVALAWLIFQFRLARGYLHRLLIALPMAELIIFATLDDNKGGVYEALYWQTGMLTYVAPLICLTIYAGYLKHVYERAAQKFPASRAYTLGTIFFSVSLAFIAGGFSETYVALQTCLLLVAVVACQTSANKTLRRTLLPLLIAGLVASVTAAIIILLAPGNKVRQAFYPPHPAWPVIFKTSLEHALGFIIGEHNYPGTRLVRAAALLLPMVLGFQWPPRERESKPTALQHMSRGAQWLLLLLSPIIALCLIAVCFAPAMYGMSVEPPPRALITPQFVLICCAAMYGYTAGSALKHAYLSRSPNNSALLNGLFIAVSLALMFAPVEAARRTFARVPKTRALAYAWDKEDQSIRAAKSRGETDLTVQILYNIGGTDSMSGDPHWFVNQCAAAYYGVNSITAKPEGESMRIMMLDEYPR